MVLLIDTNVIIDVLKNREPFVKESAEIWDLCESRKMHGYITTLTFADIVYVMRKYLDHDSIYELLSKMSLIFEFRDYRSTDMMRAAMLGWDDYEDAVQSVVAKRLKADFIITRNEKDYADSMVPAISPKDFLKLIGDAS